MDLRDYPRFPMPPSRLDEVVEAAYDQVRLQVLRSTLAVKESLGMNVDEDAWNLYDAKQAVDYREEFDDERRRQLEQAHRHGTSRYRECCYGGLPVDVDSPSMDEVEVLAVRMLNNLSSSCSDFDESGDSVHRDLAIAMDLLAMLPEQQAASAVSEAGFNRYGGSGWTGSKIRAWEASFLANGAVVEPGWLTAIFAHGPEQTAALTQDAVLRMGRSGFSPTFAAAAQWLYDRAVHKMPASVEVGLAFLREIKKRGVTPAVPDDSAQNLAALIDSLPAEDLPAKAVGANAMNWGIAVRSFVLEDSMRTALAAAGHGVAADSAPSATNAPPRRRQRVSL